MIGPDRYIGHKRGFWGLGQAFEPAPVGKDLIRGIQLGDLDPKGRFATRLQAVVEDRACELCFVQMGGPAGVGLKPHAGGDKSKQKSRDHQDHSADPQTSNTLHHVFSVMTSTAKT